MTSQPYPLTTDARLTWMPAEVAVYRRQDGLHATFILWDADDPKPTWELLDLRSGEVMLFASKAEAHEAAVKMEADRGREAPIERQADG